MRSGHILSWADVQKACSKASFDVQLLTGILYISAYVTPVKFTNPETSAGSTSPVSGAFESPSERDLSELHWEVSLSDGTRRACSQVLKYKDWYSPQGVFLYVHIFPEGASRDILVIQDMGNLWERVGIDTVSDTSGWLMERKEIRLG